MLFRSLAREPTFNLGTRFFPDQKIPGEQGHRERHPSVKAEAAVKPHPPAKNEVWMRHGGQARQQQESDQSIAANREQQSDQAHQLKPVPRRGRIATRAHGLLRQEIQATTFAKQGPSPTVLEWAPVASARVPRGTPPKLLA